jgi:Na+/proline symporter
LSYESRLSPALPADSAAGATIQVLLFAVLAIEVKRKAPTCHTVLEIVKARWGTTAHLVFLVFCMMTNLIVTGMLILGGAAVVTALTGKPMTCLPNLKCFQGRRNCLCLPTAA